MQILSSFSSDFQTLIKHQFSLYFLYELLMSLRSGLEGLDAFQDLMTHTTMKPWYDRVKETVKTHTGAQTL